MLSSFEQVIRAKGTGRSRIDAFQDALRAMRKRVMDEHDEAILQMEPIGCDVVSAVRHSKTERFLGVLFPREQVRFELTLDITVAMKVVDVEAIPVKERRESLSLAKHLLEMR